MHAATRLRGRELTFSGCSRHYNSGVSEVLKQLNSEQSEAVNEVLVRLQKFQNFIHCVTASVCLKFLSPLTVTDILTTDR